MGSVDVIGEMRDIMPNKALVIHEYRTHGTCSGLDPENYYDVARDLYDRVSVPAAFDDPPTRRFLSAEKIETEFPRGQCLASTRHDLGDLPAQKPFDVRVCFGRDLRPQACGANEDQKRLCSRAIASHPSI